MKDFFKDISYLGYWVLENLVFLLVCIILVFFSGCASKTIGSSESSAKIMNSYINKPIPEGWYWNFGIGSNFGKAMEDANVSSAYTNPSGVSTKVMPMKENTNDQRRFIISEAYNTWTPKGFCELRESWDVPEGIMVVRVCPELSYFWNGFSYKQSDEERAKNVKWSFNLGKLFAYVDKKINDPKGKDLGYLIAFREETKEQDPHILMANFYNNPGEEPDSAEDLINFVETNYKNWYNKLGKFKDPYLKAHYAIMYPYPMRFGPDYKPPIEQPNQLWKLTENGTIVGRKLKLSDAQLMGLVPIPKSSEFEYYSKKPEQFKN